MTGSDFSADFTSNSRISTCSGSWLASCDGDVTVTAGDKIWVCLVALNGSHDGAGDLRLDYSKDGGAFQALGTTGDLIQTSGCTDPGNSGCQTVEVHAVVQSNNHYNFTGITKDAYVEMLVAVDTSNATGGSIYTFKLYDITAGAYLDLEAYASITIAQALSKSLSEIFLSTDFKTLKASILKKENLALPEMILKESQKIFFETKYRVKKVIDKKG